MFCRTQWPSPEEYSQLEVQTSLGRTDIVRWFKDHRSALKNGETLDWMEGFQNQNLAEQQKAGQEQNGQSSEKNQSVSLEVKAVKGELWRRTWSFFCSLNIILQCVLSPHLTLCFLCTFLILQPLVQWRRLVRTQQQPQSTPSCPTKTKSSG